MERESRNSPFRSYSVSDMKSRTIESITSTDEDGLAASRGISRRNNQIFEQFDQSLFRRLWFYGEFGLIKYFHSYLY